MLKSMMAVTVLVASMSAVMLPVPSLAQGATVKRIASVRARLDHFSGTDYVLVISDIPSEITSITCERWTMLGLKSYEDQNNFTIPAAPAGGVALAVITTKGFDGYCKEEGSIVAHTDDGDYTGSLDRGAGNWTDSTKLTFTK